MSYIIELMGCEIMLLTMFSMVCNMVPSRYKYMYILYIQWNNIKKQFSPIQMLYLVYSEDVQPGLCSTLTKHLK